MVSEDDLALVAVRPGLVERRVAGTAHLPPLYRLRHGRAEPTAVVDRQAGKPCGDPECGFRAHLFSLFDGDASAVDAVRRWAPGDEPVWRIFVRVALGGDARIADCTDERYERMSAAALYRNDTAAWEIARRLKEEWDLHGMLLRTRSGDEQQPVLVWHDALDVVSVEHGEPQAVSIDAEPLDAERADPQRRAAEVGDWLHRLQPGGFRKCLAALHAFGFADAALADTLRVSERSVRRWRNEPQSRARGYPEQAKTVADDLRALAAYGLADGSLANSDVVSLLRARCRELSYARPTDVLAEGRFEDAVAAADIFLHIPRARAGDHSSDRLSPSS